MDLKKIRLKIDPEEGGWVPLDAFHADFKGTRVKVRALNNLDMERMLARLTNEIPLDQRINGMDPDDDRRISRELLCETVLIGWDGITDDGKDVPYSPELARTIIMDPMNIRFANAVRWAAMQLQDLGAKSLEASVKN